VKEDVGELMCNNNTKHSLCLLARIPRTILEDTNDAMTRN
jgi:hypothetical protein